MTPKYNIVIIAGQLVVGGAERQLYLWLSRMDREKFQPVVLTLHPGHADYWESHIMSLGISLVRIPHRRARLLRALDIVNILRPYQPHLIHGWHSFASPYAGIAAKLLGAKSLGGLRDSLRMFTKSPLVASMTLLSVDAMLVNSYSAAGQLAATRKRNGQIIYTVQNAVEDREQDRLLVREKLRQQFSISQSNILIGSLGRLDPKKRFDLLLNILALLHRDIEDFHFLLIGDGSERPYLEKMVDELNIRPIVTFVGEIPDAGAWLTALDIFCFTSLDEGIPNAVMEAAVAGVPIVGWRVPFMEELLKNDDLAVLVEPENLEGFKNKLIELIQDPELRNRLGQSVRHYMLEQFPVGRFIQQMTDVYEDLLKSFKRPRSGSA